MLGSASFNAAGIEGLQLIFYPCGYGGATEGFCSLGCPAPRRSEGSCEALSLRPRRRHVAVQPLRPDASSREMSSSDWGPEAGREPQLRRPATQGVEWMEAAVLA